MYDVARFKKRTAGRESQMIPTRDDTEDEAEAEAIDPPEAAVSVMKGRSLSRQVLWLGFPVLVEQFMHYLVAFSDTLLTGHFLTVNDLAAVTVGSYLFWFFGSLLMVASAGGTALVARMVGAGDWPSANRLARQSIALALAVGVVLGAFGLAFTPWMVATLGLEGNAARSAVIFVRVIAISAPLIAGSVAGVACLRGSGDTRTGMWVVVLVNVINVSVSWLLVKGWGPIPPQGIAGVAIGTATAEAIGGVIVLSVLAHGRSGLSLSRLGWIPSPPDLRRLLRVSLPAAGESASNSVCQLWFLSLINALGPNVTAAHGVALRSEAIAFLTVNAFSVAASTLTGQYLGARRPDLAARAARTAWLMGVVVLSALGVLLFFGAEPLFSLFLGRDREDVRAIGAPVLRLVAFALPFLATINILSGALRGAGDTRWPWLIVLFGYLVVRIPLTILMTRTSAQGGWEWGLYGAWVAMFADLVVRGTLIASRYLHGGWKRIEV